MRHYSTVIALFCFACGSRSMLDLPGEGEGTSEESSTFHIDQKVDLPLSDDTETGGSLMEGGFELTYDIGIGFCGDGQVDEYEECDTALPLVQPCPNQIGDRECQADCTWDEQWCSCPAGSKWCQCDNGVCDGDGQCLNGVCWPACGQAGEPCSAAEPCCAALSCTEFADPPGTWACV